MKTFFTSDTHFNHESILKYCARPWSSVSEMNEALISFWNEVVTPEDTVYHLGDFAMGDRDLIPSVLSRLNGRIILIRGNHDKTYSLKYFPEVHDRIVLDMNGHMLELVHNPSHAQMIHEKGITFCGHVHEKWSFKDTGNHISADVIEDHEYRHGEFYTKTKIYNVGIDVRGYTPRTFEEIVLLCNLA